MQLVHITAPLPRFEWDEQKREGNLQKHGVDFVDAAAVFLGPVGLAEGTGGGAEERYLAVGEGDGRVLAVVFTWRAGSLRIISARRASRDERRTYRDLRSPEA